MDRVIYLYRIKFGGCQGRKVWKCSKQDKGSSTEEGGLRTSWVLRISLTKAGPEGKD